MTDNIYSDAGQHDAVIAARAKERLAQIMPDTTQNRETPCIRCGLKPAVYEFICVDCLYDDYNLAFKMWKEWQELAERMGDLFGTTGAEDYPRYAKLLDRMKALKE